jgi:hypothetical protein
MVRSALAVLALTLLPLGALAQEPESSAPQEARTHTVVEGNTLWSLAVRYLGDGGEWRRLYEVNREVIADPAVLEPGMVLTIPAAGSSSEVAVVGVEVEGADAGEPSSEGAAMPGMRAPSEPEPDESRPAVPQEAPEQEAHPRTAFYERESAAVRVNEIPDVQGPAFSEDTYHEAPWLLEEGMSPRSLGYIGGFVSGDDLRAKTTVRPYEEVWIEGGAALPGPGTRLQAFRITERDVDALDRDIVSPTGVLTVIDRAEGGVVARVDGLFSHMEVGDRVRELPTFPLAEGVRARPAGRELVAEVVGFAREHALEAEDDFIFLSAGSADGIRPGDIFQVGGILPGARRRDSARARLQVVTVHAGYSTARISRLMNPGFRLGLQARLIERLP